MIQYPDTNSFSQLALKASQLLEQTKLSELRSSIARSLSELEMFTEDGESMDTPKRKSAINERMEDLVSAPLAVEDALVGLFDHSDHTLQRRVVETYVRRLYQVHSEPHWSEFFITNTMVCMLTMNGFFLLALPCERKCEDAVAQVWSHCILGVLGGAY